jgi:hypothetical protein
MRKQTGDDMRSVAIVCVRALAAYLIIFNANTAAMMLATRLSLERGSDLDTAPLIVFGTMIALGLAMLAWSKRLADLATKDLTEEERRPADSRMAIHIGTALLGIYLIATALPNLAEAWWRHFTLGDDTDARVQVQKALALASLIQAIVGIAVGCLLILPRVISNLGIFRASNFPPAAPPPPSR